MEDKQKLADDIINHHVKWSMGAGMVWVPVIDWWNDSADFCRSVVK